MGTSIDFPSSPSIGQQYTYGSTTYEWDGTQWFAGSIIDIATEVTYENLNTNGDVGTVASTVAAGDDSRFTPTYATMGTDLKGKVTVAASNIDWSAGAHFTKTLTGNLTLTFSNLQESKTITFTASGNYTLSLPAYVNIISGEYDGTVDNFIQFYCEESSGGSEIVWCEISQEAA